MTYVSLGVLLNVSQQLYPCLTYVPSARSFAVNHVEERTEYSNVGIAHIFCDYKLPETQRDVDILRSITRQLVERVAPLPEAVKSFRDKYTEKTRNPTIDEWVTLVEEVSKAFSKVFIFIDALVNGLPRHAVASINTRH